MYEIWWGRRGQANSILIRIVSWRTRLQPEIRRLNKISIRSCPWRKHSIAPVLSIKIWPSWSYSRLNEACCSCVLTAIYARDGTFFMYMFALEHFMRINSNKIFQIWPRRTVSEVYLDTKPSKRLYPRLPKIVHSARKFPSGRFGGVDWCCCCWCWCGSCGWCVCVHEKLLYCFSRDEKQA